MPSMKKRARSKDEGHGFAKKINNDRRREVETQFLQKVLGTGAAQ